jgi:C-terminal processing protease CtpA/Prc
MPRTKKPADVDAREPIKGARNGRSRGNGTAARRAADTTPRTERVAVVGAVGPPEDVQIQFDSVRGQLAELGRQAAEARGEVKALREEREAIGRELGEIRKQLRAAQEQALRDTREGYEKVGKELNTTAGRLNEAVRHAQEQVVELTRQAREARRDVDELHDIARRTHRRAIDEETPEGRERTGQEGTAGKGRAKARRAKEPARAEAGNRLGITVGPGVVVAEVLPNSPAAAAGLARGDVIDQIGKRPILSAIELRDAVHRLSDGDDVVLQVIRAGESRKLTARLDKPSGEAAEANGGRNRLGVTVGPGVIVAEVIGDSPADEAGLVRGDMIDDVNGTPVTSGDQLRDLIQRLPARSEATLRVTRAGDVEEVRVRLDGAEASS